MLTQRVKAPTDVEINTRFPNQALSQASHPTCTRKTNYVHTELKKNIIESS